MATICTDLFHQLFLFSGITKTKKRVHFVEITTIWRLKLRPLDPWGNKKEIRHFIFRNKVPPPPVVVVVIV